MPFGRFSPHRYGNVTMTLSRRALLSASLALPLAMPALRRASADPVARLALLHMNDFHSKHEGTDAGSACNVIPLVMPRPCSRLSCAACGAPLPVKVTTTWAVGLVRKAARRAGSTVACPKAVPAEMPSSSRASTDISAIGR